MVKPKPVPPYLRFISTEPCENFKTVSSLSLGMPIPVSIILKDTIAFPFCNDSNLVLVVTLPSLVILVHC
jgi:hypothetical protein